MSTAITLRIGTLEFSGQLNDSSTARALLVLLPASIRLSR